MFSYRLTHYTHDWILLPQNYEFKEPNSWNSQEHMVTSNNCGYNPKSCTFIGFGGRKFL